MNREERFAAWGATLAMLITIAIVVAVVWVAAHFVAKYW